MSRHHFKELPYPEKETGIHAGLLIFSEKMHLLEQGYRIKTVNACLFKLGYSKGKEFALM